MEDILNQAYISNLDTYLFWRDKLNNFKVLEEKTGKRFPTMSEFLKATSGNTHSVCPVCDGGMVWDLGEVRVRCICLLLDWIQTMIQRLQNLRTYANKASLEEFEIWGENQEKRQSLVDAVEAVKAFYRDPRKWLVLFGAYGSGKTHLMQYLAREFGPFALYISSTDFESILFRAMDDGDLNRVMWSIERAPILLFDDWGSEHGSAITRSKFRQIIDFRYNLYPEYPVVITTNEKPKEIYRSYDSRTASRIFDKDRSNIVIITAGDYRLRT